MRQIDTSIRRFDESVRRQKKHEADLDRRMEERDAESREREAQLRLLTEETREFNREILLRNEKVYTSLIAEMEEGRKQIRANTQAVLSMLDRFNGPGEAAA